MTVTIDFPPDLETTLHQHAERSGQDIRAFVLQAVQEKLTRTRSFEEICAPFAEAVRATGMSEEELERFFEEARDEIWREKHGSK